MGDSLTDVVDLDELTFEFTNESQHGQETSWTNTGQKNDKHCRLQPQGLPEDRVARVASNYLEDKHVPRDLNEINSSHEKTDMLVSEDEDYLSISVLPPDKHGDRDDHFQSIFALKEQENSDVLSLSMLSAAEHEKNDSLSLSMVSVAEHEKNDSLSLSMLSAAEHEKTDSLSLSMLSAAEHEKNYSLSLSMLPPTEKGDNEDFSLSISPSADHTDKDVYSRSMLPPAEHGGKEALFFSKIPFTEHSNFDSEFDVPYRPVSSSKLHSTDHGDSDSEFVVPDKPLRFSKLHSTEHGDSNSEFVVPGGQVPFLKLHSKEHDDSDSEFVVAEEPIPFSKLPSTEHGDSDSEFVVPDRPVSLSSSKTYMQNDKKNNSQTSDSTSKEFIPGGFHPVTSLNMLPSYPGPIQTNAASTSQYYTGQLASQDNKLSQNYQVQGQSRSTTHQDLNSTTFDKHKLVNTQAGSIDQEHQRPIIFTTEADWDDIETVQPEFQYSSHGISAPPVPESKPLAVFSDVWLQFENDNYSSVKNQIRTHIDRQGFSALKHFLFGPPKLHRDLLLQKERIFCIAATQLDNSQEHHLRVLQTIYRTLTGSRFDCQRFGGHWEEIGFQGRDPATDLRGTGMLALLQLLFFLQSSKTRDLARDVYKLSLHPTQNFPFCIMSINLTRICLQLLRADVLNKECNSRREVTSTFHDIYAALCLRLYREWRTGKTIADSGFVLKDLELYCHKHSKNILKDLSKFEKDDHQNRQRRKSSDAELTFLNVCKEDKKG